MTDAAHAPTPPAASADASDDKILKLLAIATATREWVRERDPADRVERALFVAVFDAFPEDFPGRENCDCDQSETTCDECPSIHEIRRTMAIWRAEAVASQGSR